jgi:nicotinic acid mononucleotide adenylyltransferase
MTTTLSSSISFESDQEHLFDRIERLLKQNDTKCHLVVAVAGGGTFFASTLAATPGASSILMEAVTLYDRESFRTFTAQTSQQQEPKLQYASMHAAQRAATAALQRALQFTVGSTTSQRPTYRALSQMPFTVGLACASQLRSEGKCTANIVAHLPHGSSVQITFSIPTYLSRRHQDLQVAHAMLTCLEYAMQLREDDYQDTISNTIWEDRLAMRLMVTKMESSGKEWTETLGHGEEGRVQIHTQSKCPVIQAAESIVTGQESVVLLVPQHEQYRVIQGSVATLPPHSLIVPGSFNPPHTGHVQLAVAAYRRLLSKTPNPVIWFELSLTNADKPALAPSVAVERIQQFWKLLPELQDYQWGILLTNAPLFAQKIDLLYPMTQKGKGQARPSDDDDELTFCVGTDTLLRLLDPKYYGNSRKRMLTTLKELPCHFVAGGRVDPKQPNVFVTGVEAVAELPPRVAAMFTLLPEFRVDISSTELRRQRDMEV